MTKWLFLTAIFAALLPASAFAAAGDFVFVGQVPSPFDFTTVMATFGNQRGSLDSVARGGDLFIRYADGTVKNLTRAAGLGVVGFQGAGAIAVRDPAVHWSGTKVLFSMVIGGATRQYELGEYRWQLYEISGLGKTETPVVTKVANQPAGYNNVMPVYGTDERIIFSTDRPRDGSAHLYPQRDEYESAPTNTGLWSLDPATGDLFQLDHTPSGAFHPIIDSFGRVIYTRWDHLQRDQQAGGLTDYGAFNYSDESAAAAKSASQAEVFPEPRSVREQTDPTLNLHSFNEFFPWQINEDGTEHETINHVGRHELVGYIPQTFNNDSNLEDFYGQYHRANTKSIGSLLQLREDPLHAGTYYGINCPEFGTHAAGQIVAFSAPPVLPADQIQVQRITPDSTAGTSAAADNSGHFRNPLPLSTGTLIAAHTSEFREDRNDGSSAAPVSRYAFRLRVLNSSGGTMVPGAFLTGGLPVSTSYWDPDQMVSYSGNLWEIQPVELLARSKPARRQPTLPDPETAVFAQSGVDVAAFRNYLRQNGLALIVSRNVTTRDSADIQQPFNLRVAGTSTQTLGAAGKIYDIAHLQLFQGDQIRGYGGVNDPQAGRRVLAQPLHDPAAANPANPGGPAGSVRIGADGSLAALVPARRALTWQLTDGQGNGVVRERLWLTFQPGEIRVCTSCHGLNSHDQAGGLTPTNQPAALLDLLRSVPNGGGGGGGGSGGGGGGGSPGGSLQVVSISHKKPVSGVLLPGTKFQAIATATANSAASIQFAVDGAQCPVQPRAFTLSAAGTKTLSAKTPSSPKNATVSVNLSGSNGAVVTSTSAALYSSKRRQQAAPLTAKQLRSICKSLAKLR